MKKNNFHTLFLIGFWMLLLGIAVPVKGQTYGTSINVNGDFELASIFPMPNPPTAPNAYTAGTWYRNSTNKVAKETTNAITTTSAYFNSDSGNDVAMYQRTTGLEANTTYKITATARMQSAAGAAGGTSQGYMYVDVRGGTYWGQSASNLATGISFNNSSNTTKSFEFNTGSFTDIVVMVVVWKSAWGKGYFDDFKIEKKLATITTSSANGAMGSVSASSTVNWGSSTSVTATPNSGYIFVNWTENGSQVSTNATYNFTASADRNLVANFEPVSSASISVTGSLSSFSSTYGTASAEQSFSVSGSSLTSDIVVTPPTGFEVSTTSGSGFQSSVSLTPSSGSVASTTIYVRLKALAAAGTYSAANITVNTTGSSQNVSCSGTQAKKTLSISGTAIANKTYNGLTGTGTITVGTITGFVDTETVTATATGSFSTANVGTWQATVVYTLVNGTNGGLASNYSLANSTVWANINSKQLNITAGNQTITYGTAASAVTDAGSHTYSGFVNGETAATAITGTPTYTTTYTNTTAAGTSGVTITYNTGLTIVNGNYWFNKIAGTITITKATPTLSVSGTQSFTYNGSAQGPATVNYNGDGTTSLLFTSTDGGGYSSATAPTNVGAYQVVASATAGTNYNTATSGAYPFTIYSSGNISSATNISDLTLSPGSTLSVASGATLTIDANTEVASVTVAQGGKLTLSGSSTLAVTGGITLQNTASGTASFVDSRTADNPTAIAGTVEQAITGTDRNWYVAVPVTGRTASDITLSGASIVKRNEATVSWEPVSAGTALTAGVGYIAVASASGGNATWTLAGNLQSGKVEVNVTRSGASSAGFNLLGNPYPSYLNWEQVLNLNATNASTLQPTIWYRTATYNEGLSKYDYTFNTYNSVARIATPTSTTGYIPPMQAFWVRANSAGTVTFTNAMRSHGDGASNKLKAPAVNTQKIVRLQVANTASISDETVLHFDVNAQNSFDNYDSPKMFNNVASKPEIFTSAGAEKLVINGMNDIPYNTEIPLGFVTGQTGDFSISRTEFTNFNADTRILLKDALNPATEFELAEGVSYNFSAQPTTATTNRFSLVFRAPGVTTGIDKTSKLNTQVFVNAANQIVIIAPVKSNYAIYNAMGQLMENGVLNTERETRNTKLTTGVYIVKVGNTNSTRVIIK